MSSDPAFNSSELIDQIYAVAVDPDRLQALVRRWDESLSAQDSGSDYGFLEAPQYESHLGRAMTVLQAVGLSANTEAADPMVEALDNVPTAAFLTTVDGVITHLNRAAQDSLGVEANQHLDHLPLERGAHDELLGAVRSVLRDRSSPAQLLRFRLQQADRLVLLQVRADPDHHRRRAVVVSTELTWPSRLGSLLVDAFRLTQAEIEVLEAVTRGDSIRDIAKSAGRSEATVRSHLHALFGKTGARSQVELVRVTLGLLDISRTVPLEGPPQPDRSSRTQNVYLPTRLPDGRLVHRLELGDPKGRPFLWLPGDYGLTRWTEAAESALYQRGLRMIVFVRAGYGASSPAPQTGLIYDHHVQDLLHMVQQLGLPSLPLVCYGDDFRIAVQALTAAPERFCSILACGAGFPAYLPEHYARMPLWYRFIRSNARFAPKVAPFLIKAGFGLARRAGRRRFVQAIFGESKADMECIADESIMQAMLLGSEIVISDSHMAIDAFSAECIAFQGNWDDLIAPIQHRIVLFHGDQDANSPWPTLMDYMDRFPGMRLIGLENEGVLAFLRRWPELVELVAEISGTTENKAALR